MYWPYGNGMAKTKDGSIDNISNLLAKGHCWGGGEGVAKGTRHLYNSSMVSYCSMLHSR